MKRLILFIMVFVSSSVVHAQEVEQVASNQDDSSQLKVLLQESKSMQQQLSLAVKKSDKEKAVFIRKMSLAAKAYTALKEKFAQLRQEKALLKDELSLAKKENREFSKDCAQASTKCSKIEKYAQKFEAQNEKLSQELALVKKDYAQLSKEYAQAGKTIDGAARQYEKELASAIKDYASELKAAKNNYAKIDKERSALQEKCGEFQQASRELETKLEQQRAAFKEAQAEFQEFQKQALNERSLLEKKCDQAQKELYAAREQQEKLEGSLESLKQAHVTVVNENKVLCAQARDYDKTARTLHKTAEKSAKECEKLQKHLTVALDERAAISAHYKEKLASTQQQLQALSHEHKKSLTQLAQIGEVRKKLEGKLKEHLALNDIARDDMVAHFENQVKALDSLNKEKALALREKRMLALKLEENSESMATLKNAYLALKEQVKVDRGQYKEVCSALKKELHSLRNEPRKLQASLHKKDARIKSLENMYAHAMQKQKAGESLRVALMMRLKNQEKEASQHIAEASISSFDINDASKHAEVANKSSFDIDDLMSNEIINAATDTAVQEQEIAQAYAQESAPMLAQDSSVSNEKIEAIVAKASQAKQKVKQVRSRRRRGSLWG